MRFAGMYENRLILANWRGRAQQGIEEMMSNVISAEDN